MDELSESIADDLRAAEGGWAHTPAMCPDCGHQWEAVWPLDLSLPEPESDAALDEGIAQLPCPNCGQEGRTQERETD